MKKLQIIIIVIMAASVSAGASQDGESLSRLYRRLSGIDQKYAVMQTIVTLDDRSLEPFLEAALRDLVYGDLSQFRTRTGTYDKWEALVRIVVMELGDIKGQSAASTVWDVARTAEVPLLKAESLIALGRMQAVEYASQIAIILRNLNFNTRADKEAAEIEAYGAVVALNTMKDDAGFEPLFYASIGWYRDRVTEIAREAVLNAFDDPIPQLVVIMENTLDYAAKRQVLEMAVSTGAPNSSKVLAVASALSEGLRYVEADPSRRQQLTNLRMDGITAYITLGISDEDVSSLLDQAIDEGELDEKLVAIQALGTDGSDQAAQLLADRLAWHNGRQADGVTLNREELTIVRQIVFALGESENEIGLGPLSEMEYVDYTPALERQAVEAIQRIKGN